MQEANSPENKKLMFLARIGLVNKNEIALLRKAVAMKSERKPLPFRYRDILFKVMDKMIDMVTGKTQMFNRARQAVREEKEIDLKETLETFIIAINNLINEEDEYDQDAEMTKSELRIACQSAENILAMMEKGAKTERWQVSEIVKASEGLSTVYLNMSADKDQKEDTDLEEEGIRRRDTRKGGHDRFASSHDNYEYASRDDDRDNIRKGPLGGPSTTTRAYGKTHNLPAGDGPGYRKKDMDDHAKAGEKHRKVIPFKKNKQNEEVEDEKLEEKRGLWDNIHAKRERIRNGSGERMRKPGSKGAPTAQDFKDSQSEDTELEEAGYNDLPQTKAEVKKKYPDTETDVKNKKSIELQPLKYK